MLSAEAITSRSNILYSYYKPTKQIFIKKVKEYYLSNKALKEAYKNPTANSVNAFRYALAMDYVYEDGTEKIRHAYELAAFSIDKANGFLSILQYYDFLIRTERYSELDKLKVSTCGREAPQCVYYKVVSKHLTNRAVSKEECQEAMLFLPMRKITLQICSEK